VFSKQVQREEERERGVAGVGKPSAGEEKGKRLQIKKRCPRCRKKIFFFPWSVHKLQTQTTVPPLHIEA
jgi:ribosomal protein L44E